MAVVSDVVVVGGGHNSLVCAAYLAQAGLSVTVLEAREVIGGNTITEELTLPGWQHDSCSTAHVVIQANPLLRDDELGLLSRYGLEYVATDPAVVFPLGEGDALVLHPDLDASASEFARFSDADARALVSMMDEWNGGLRRGHGYYSAGLPPPDAPWALAYEQLRRRTAWDVVASTFEHPVIRRVMTWLAFTTFKPPERPGTGALPAAIMSGRLQHGWGTPIGGSGALPRALVACLEDLGSTVVASARVNGLVTEAGRCVAARTDDGREFRATKAVVTGGHLRELHHLLDTESAVADDAAARWQPGISLFAVHFALRTEAAYHTRHGGLQSAAGGLGDTVGTLRQAPGVLAGDLERLDPWLLIMSPTAVDPDRAPGGTLKFLTAAPELLDGKPWTDEDATEYAVALRDLTRPHLAGLEDGNILAMRPESPTSLAAHNISNIGGSCHGGEFRADDGSAIVGWPDLRTDVPGLYLTGSTSHPGGSVSGRPGRNAARAVLEDLGLPWTMATP